LINLELKLYLIKEGYLLLYCPTAGPLFLH